MGIETQVAEGEKILQKEECPFVKSCLTIKSMNYGEQIHSCIQNYEGCPTYQTWQDNERRND